MGGVGLAGRIIKYLDAIKNLESSAFLIFYYSMEYQNNAEVFILFLCAHHTSILAGLTFTLAGLTFLTNANAPF